MKCTCMYLSGYYSPVFGTVEFCFATDFFIFRYWPNLRDAPTQTGEIV